MKDSSDYILFCDNLKTQTTTSSQEEGRKLGEIVWVSVRKMTQIFRNPLQQKWNKSLKYYHSMKNKNWLKFDENLDFLMGNSDQKSNPWQLKMLIKYWVEQTY